jgi:ribosomal protein S27E
MANRCDGCEGKFGALGDPEVEIESEESNEEILSVDVRLDVSCANCGNEFMQGFANVETTVDVDTHDETCKVTAEDGTVVTFASDRDRFDALIKAEREFDITNAEAEATFEEEKRRRFYAITVRFDVKCSTCGDEFKLTGDSEISVGELDPV